MSNNLSEKSKSYYEEIDVYQRFSDAEDYLKLVENYLMPEVKDKIVLDLGCGNGKYLNLFRHSANIIYGLDLSPNQLSLVKDSKKIICADASQLPIRENSLDLIYSCWMFGTILDEQRRLCAMTEAKRILKPGGKIILVENSNSGEFEKVRGRLDDSCERTKKYNNWIISQDFIKVKELKTYFKFNSAQEANDTFKNIWKDRFMGSVNEKIQHNISIFEWAKID